MHFGQNINVNFHSNQQFPIDAYTKYYCRLDLQDYMQEASEFKTNEICFVTSDWSRPSCGQNICFAIEQVYHVFQTQKSLPISYSDVAMNLYSIN